MTPTTQFALTFKAVYAEYLHIQAFAKGVHPLSTVHLNAKVFAAAVRLAGLPEEKAFELEAAAMEAWLTPGVDVCCEIVELSDKQLEIFGLVPRSNFK